MKSNRFTISVVVPVMNEEGNIEPLSEKLTFVLRNYDDYEIIFVDDGSADGTLSALKKRSKENRKFKYLSFSRNFGHQNALKAGLDHAIGDCVISMDGDLQHPPELIPRMVEKWREGYDIVCTLREDDAKTGFFKRYTSRMFYKVINHMADMDMRQGNADFRLVDKQVVDIIRKIHETPLFFRGMIHWLGFKQFAIPYMPEKRFSGETKYSVKNMFKFALAGITGFSVKPLYFSIKLGFVIAVLAIAYGIYALYIRLFTDTAIEGWTSLLIVMSFIGGIQLISLGVLGEYIGKMFMEQKRRPNYIVREKSDAETPTAAKPNE